MIMSKDKSSPEKKEVLTAIEMILS
jgi:hypothetical protein